MMNPATKVVLVFVIAFALSAGPTILLALVYFFPDAWRRALHDNQTIFGSLVTLFAAGVALGGVWMTVASQTTNVENQLNAQRDQFDRELKERRATEDRAQSMQRRQIASAFVGEINVIITAFGGEEWRANASHSLDELKRARTDRTQAVRLQVSRPTGDYATFFRANAREIGQFPQPIPEKLMMLYGIYTELQDNLTQVSRASDADFKNMDAPNVERALELQLSLLNRLPALGKQLIPELQAIAAQP
jgi:hypothetical protein